MIREIIASIFSGVSATAGFRANGKRFSVRACPGGSIIAACDLDHFLFAQFPFYIFSGAVRTGLTAGESEPDRSGSFFYRSLDIPFPAQSKRAAGGGSGKENG